MSGKEKKTTKKKAAPKKEEPFPANPTRAYGATVRKMRVPKTEAAKLVKNFEFRVISDQGEICEVVADGAANRKYEASN